MHMYSILDIMIKLESNTIPSILFKHELLIGKINYKEYTLKVV